MSQQGRSGSGPGTATRVSHSLRITRQVHNDGQRLQSSWEVSLWAKVQVQITGVNGQAQAWLLLWPGPSSKTSTHHPAGMARASLPRHMAATAPQVLSWPQAHGAKAHHHWGWRGERRSAHNDTHFRFGGSSRTGTSVEQWPSCCSKPATHPGLPRAVAW